MMCWTPQTGAHSNIFLCSQQLMLMAVLNCLFDSLSQMLRYGFTKLKIKPFTSFPPPPNV